MRFRNLIAGLAILSGTACYHAIIETGLTPNGTTIKKEWAHSWLGGLVPPSTIETISKCPNGVARVETQLSFLNLVASTITAGIYSPMQIDVECAAAKTAVIKVPKDASSAQKEEAVTEAIKTGKPIQLL